MHNIITDEKEFLRLVETEGWGPINKYPLSEELIRKYSEDLDWHLISVYSFLSENFIEEFQDKVDWTYISMYQELSEDFIIKMYEKISIYNLLGSKKFSESFIKKLKLSYFHEFTYLVKHQNLSQEFIESFKDKVFWNTVVKELFNISTGQYSQEQCYKIYKLRTFI